MATRRPDRETLHAALALAVRAPSVHNSQPWLWRVGDTSVHLYADLTQHLPATDPDQRDLLVSCGAALHHLRIAALGLGWEARIDRLPDPADPEHLAAVEFRRAEPATDPRRLSRAIEDRRTDRRRYTSWEVTAAQVSAMIAAGASCGVVVRDIENSSARAALEHAFERAAWQHARDFHYGSELARWSGRRAAAQGVPARSAVASLDAMARPFANPGLPQAVLRDTEGVERILVLATGADDRMSRLRAGEATSAVLLTATMFGMATCPLTEPLELPDTRAAISRDVLDDSGFPQMIIRVGWAATSSQPLLPTPRRPLDEVVTYLRSGESEPVKVNPRRTS
ncbi:Acg family FMN-binding oxidoreductase [Nocardia sp. alder85J]|uniref:Acg family FMN-binding oxidoreductase n=1 Tax=Nocardia sp. alder85J TaxID=2862949 RepID=UPI001CD4A43F|nr:NAD(P)H nitroreductase [Nocardia sp. alder85J]MCX4092424.1 NAD(P)H nitroreductase [Nocardia sp. alder85J]